MVKDQAKDRGESKKVLKKPAEQEKTSTTTTGASGQGDSIQVTLEVNNGEVQVPSLSRPASAKED